MTRVLIVDDHPVVRAGLRRLLSDSTGIEVAGEADSARSALERSRAEPWDLILLDMGLPDADGLELLTQLKLDQPHRPVLVLTMRLNGELAVRALRAGAAGYLGKDTPPATIVEAVRRAAAGRTHVTEWLAEQLATRVRTDAGEPAHARLSDREFEILLLLAGGARPKDIATRLSLSIKTVSSYRARVLEKLALSSNAELAIYAIRHGLIDDRRVAPMDTRSATRHD